MQESKIPDRGITYKTGLRKSLQISIPFFSPLKQTTLLNVCFSSLFSFLSIFSKMGHSYFLTTCFPYYLLFLQCLMHVSCCFFAILRNRCSCVILIALLWYRKCLLPPLPPPSPPGTINVSLKSKAKQNKKYYHHH